MTSSMHAVFSDAGSGSYRFIQRDCSIAIYNDASGSIAIYNDTEANTL